MWCYGFLGRTIVCEKFTVSPAPITPRIIWMEQPAGASMVEPTVQLCMTVPGKEGFSSGKFITEATLQSRITIPGMTGAGRETAGAGREMTRARDVTSADACRSLPAGNAASAHFPMVIVMPPKVYVPGLVSTVRLPSVPVCGAVPLADASTSRFGSPAGTTIDGDPHTRVYVIAGVLDATDDIMNTPICSFF